jgi:hypothetical protein
MVSNAALRHLGINPKKKDKIEVYFNIKMLKEITGTLSAAGGTNFLSQISEFLESEIGNDNSNITI